MRSAYPECNRVVWVGDMPHQQDPEETLPMFTRPAPRSVPRPRLRARRSLGLVAGAAVLTLAACGGGDDEGASESAAPAEESVAADSATAATESAESPAAPVAAAGEELDAGYGAKGPWTAAQLCTLNDLTTMGALFPGVEVVERTGIDDPDWARCEWADVSFEPIDSAGDLFGINQRAHGGETLSDAFESIDVPGADQAVFAETLDNDRMSVVLATVGDQILEIEFAKDALGARDVATLIATTWASFQAL